MNRKTFIDASKGLLLRTLVLIVMPIFGGVLIPPSAGARIEPATTVTFDENDSLSDTVCRYQPGTYAQTADLNNLLTSVPRLLIPDTPSPDGTLRPTEAAPPSPTARLTRFPTVSVCMPSGVHFRP